MIDLHFLKAHARWLAAGFLLALASSFGQTYFIALFAGEIRSTFDLSHGAFGGLYTIATLASAGTLVWLGHLADRMRLAGLSAIALCALAAMSLAMAGVSSIVMLVGVLFGLRLFGQGLLTHIAMTAMARWFAEHRGRALSIAALGHPTGEAILPSIVVVLAIAIGWRGTWLAASAFLFAAAPLVFWMLRREPASAPIRLGSGARGAARSDRRQWTRSEVLRDRHFYALLPGIMAPSFMTTAVFFHQVHLAETKAWTLSWFAACYPIYALATVLVSLASGWAIDRTGAARLLPFYLVPLASGLLALATVDGPPAAVLFMTLAGITSGSAVTLLGALWAELYGTRHLGAIRALAVASMVLSSALGPGVMGALIDWGVSLEDQLLAMAAYALGAAGLFHLLTPRLRHLTAA
jgi:sugar phosphate permease